MLLQNRQLGRLFSGSGVIPFPVLDMVEARSVDVTVLRLEVMHFVVGVVRYKDLASLTLRTVLDEGSLT